MSILNDRLLRLPIRVIYRPKNDLGRTFPSASSLDYFETLTQFTLGQPKHPLTSTRHSSVLSAY